MTTMNGEADRRRYEAAVRELQALAEERTAWARRSAAELERIRQSRPVRLYGRLLTLPAVGPFMRRAIGLSAPAVGGSAGAASPDESRAAAPAEAPVVAVPTRGAEDVAWLGLSLDGPLRVDERSYFLTGQVPDDDGQPNQLTVVSPEGSRVDLPPTACWRVSPVGESPAATRFAAWVQLDEPSRRLVGWSLALTSATGIGVQATAPPVVHEPASARDLILAEIARMRPPSERLIADHIVPALERLEARRRASAVVDRVVQLGRAPDSPAVSLIVPLHRRIDSVELQLAQFAHDPDLAQVELVYVVASPELGGELLEQAALLARLYRLPWRLVILGRDGGLAAAISAGVDHARGRWLLLLNADVLPARPGWLKAMAAFFEATPRIGALGPKLLYEDDTLQHAGISFRRRDGESVWRNQHYYKGLHRDIPAANACRRVPAVTGACLMIERELFQRLGNPRGAYVHEDYAASDLCLRVMEAGHDIWYLPEAELYHLEGRSCPVDLRWHVRYYDAWLHSHLWRDRLEALAATTDGVAADGHARAWE
jgi:GT2 family glycosyltransferase